jgi:hypothetical protein
MRSRLVRRSAQLILDFVIASLLPDHQTAMAYVTNHSDCVAERWTMGLLAVVISKGRRASTLGDGDGQSPSPQRHPYAC